MRYRNPAMHDRCDHTRVEPLESGLTKLGAGFLARSASPTDASEHSYDSRVARSLCETLNISNQVQHIWFARRLTPAAVRDSMMRASDT